MGSRFTKLKGGLAAIFILLFLIAFSGSLYPDPEPRDARLKEIDQSWMSVIHNSPEEPTSAEKKKESRDIEFADPGTPVGEVKGEAPLASIQSSFSGSESEGPSFVSVAMRFFGLMAVMVGLFYLVTRYLKKKTGVISPGGDLVKVIASIPLMPGRFLQIVDLAGRLLILGTSESGVHLITEVEDAPTADRIRVWHSQRPSENLPDNLLGRLTDLIRGSDFSFWSAEKKNTGSPGKSNFHAELAAHSKASVAGERIPESVRGDDLKELLRRQKKRILQMKDLDGQQEMSPDSSH